MRAVTYVRVSSESQIDTWSISAQRHEFEEYCRQKGAKLQAMYGAYPQHTIWYVVEADSTEAVQEFLTPGFLRCTSTVTPISSVPMVKK